jgi:hypothetical protein
MHVQYGIFCFVLLTKIVIANHFGLRSSCRPPFHVQRSFATCPFTNMSTDSPPRSSIDGFCRRVNSRSECYTGRAARSVRLIDSVTTSHQVHSKLLCML